MISERYFATNNTKMNSTLKQTIYGKKTLYELEWNA